MEDINVQMSEEIERSLEESEDDLSLLSKYAADVDINKENAIDFLSSQSQIEEFENLYYIDLNGVGISLNSEVFDFSNNKAFLQALEDDFHINEPRVSTISGSMVFDVAVPVTQNDIVTGILLCEVPISDLYEIMDSTARSGWVFLVDYDLNILFTSSIGHTEFDSIPPSDIQTLGVNNVTQGVANAVNGQHGSFSYVANYGSGNTQKILTYAPISMAEWVLVVSIEESVINIDLETAVNQVATFSIVILFIIIVFIIYIWVYRFLGIRSLERVAYYDELTGLPNLTKLKKDMTTILKNNKKQKYTVIKIDVENFKAINEMFGFEIGNRVLKAFKPIRETVSESTLMIARTGVDEFILFSGNGFLDDMEQRTAIYESYYQKFIPELGSYNISFKYGRYHIPLGFTDVDEIINKLNLAHKFAKDHKGLIIYDYDENYSKKLLKDAQITSKMKSALANNEFEVYLQPKFYLKDGSLAGAEALVRWIEPNGNILLPLEFIPLFEKNGFIGALDKYVLGKVCELLKNWINSGKTPIPISINCSRENLHNSNLVNDISKVADSYGVPHQYIEIELTESATIENQELITKLFNDLQGSGFKISIDDFGAGYSSLGLLKSLRADTLKMDRSFFNDKNNANRAEHVINSFIELSHNLNMIVVAEGIENAEQIAMLKNMACDIVQGFYFSKPITMTEFEDKYINSN